MVTILQRIFQAHFMKCQLIYFNSNITDGSNWLGTKQSTSHYLTRWLILLMHICVNWPLWGYVKFVWFSKIDLIIFIHLIWIATEITAETIILLLLWLTASIHSVYSIPLILSDSNNPILVSHPHRIDYSFCHYYWHPQREYLSLYKLVFNDTLSLKPGQ